MARRLRLREWRERKLMTQQMLADKTGLRLASVSRIESGLQVPRVGTIRSLAAALDITPEELIVWDSENVESDREPEQAKAAA